MDKVLKLLKLTTSDNDHEALSAIRAANAILKKNNLIWDKIVGQGERVIFVEKEMYEPTISEMLEVCMEQVIGNGREFIESLNFFFKKNGFLTPKQKAALEKFYGNIQ